MENQKGISRLSIIPVRADGNDRAEQVTQLLFGDHYEVLEISQNGKWYRIRVHYDQYEGWIDHRQFSPITDAFFEEINNTDFLLSLEPTAQLKLAERVYQVVAGSVLPMATSDLFQTDAAEYEGKTKPQSRRMGWDFIRDIALSYLHAPYQWGGRSIFGIDCSGFSQNVYRMAGYELMRDASQQIKQGAEVTSSIEPGDLAFFASESGNVTHVGIMLEDQKIIHASGRVRIDELDDKGIIDVETGQQTHQLCGIRRILKT